MSGIRLLIEDENANTLLFITSDGEGRYSVNAPHFRSDDADEYDTEDDLHVRGIVQAILAGYMSHELLRRRLNENEAGVQ